MILNLSDIRTNFSGFSKFAALAEAVIGTVGETIVIDCTSLRWFDAHMAAPLMSIIKQSGLSGNEISFINLNPKTKEILQRNGFLAPRIEDIYGSTISLVEFEVDEQKNFSEYVEINLSAQEMPDMSKDLESKFYEGVDELFNNAVIHSKTTCGIFTCGQYFHKKNRLDFVIADAGIGIQENVRRQLGRDLRADAAIDWAMTVGSTTRQGDIPGGPGLKIIREFITLNRGRILVASNGGFWCLQDGRVTKRLLNGVFPGTVVVMEINTADNSIYYLQDEIAPHDIF